MKLCASQLGIGTKVVRLELPAVDLMVNTIGWQLSGHKHFASTQLEAEGYATDLERIV